MKTIPSLISLLTIPLICFIMACSKDDEPIDPEPNQKTIVKQDAAFLGLGSVRLMDSLNLELSFPELENSPLAGEALMILPFYRLSGDPTDIWYPIPSVHVENNLKIYHNGNGMKINIVAEEFDSSKPYGSPVDFKELRIMLVKTSSVQHINSRNELDFWNYDQMMDYFDFEG